MLGSLVNLKRYAGIGLIILLVIACSFAMIQSNRLSSSLAKIEQLQEKVEAFEEAAVLMENLRKANARLVTERDSLLQGIKDAEGYNTPLPDGIDQLLERMRINNGTDRTPKLRF